MCRHLTLLFVPLFVLAILTPVAARDQSADAIAADAARLVQALNIRAGSVVAELGAGDGALTVAIARIVGEQGRVYSTELSKASLVKIEAAAAAAGLKNVTVVEGTAAQTKLPEQCCDAIFMRDVYHHFSEPPAMNASVLASLRPGGVLWRARLRSAAGKRESRSRRPRHRRPARHHPGNPRTGRQTADFEAVSTTPIAFRSFLTVGRHPVARGTWHVARARRTSHVLSTLHRSTVARSTY